MNELLEVKTITASYIFTFGRFFRLLKENPFLIESVKYITDKVFVEGGLALSVPLEIAKKTYNKMGSLCKSRGIIFLVCGCKNRDLKEGNYPLICRNRY